jgi:hypothetical protein
MYWSGCQSTGAEMRKYLTAATLVEKTGRWAVHRACSMRAGTALQLEHVRLSTCWRATMLSGGRLC